MESKPPDPNSPSSIISWTVYGILDIKKTHLRSSQEISTQKPSQLWKKSCTTSCLLNPLIKFGDILHITGRMHAGFLNHQQSDTQRGSQVQMRIALKKRSEIPQNWHMGFLEKAPWWFWFGWLGTEIFGNKWMWNVYIKIPATWTNARFWALLLWRHPQNWENFTDSRYVVYIYIYTLTNIFLLSLSRPFCILAMSWPRLTSFAPSMYWWIEWQRIQTER